MKCAFCLRKRSNIRVAASSPLSPSKRPAVEAEGLYEKVYLNMDKSFLLHKLET